MATVHVRCALSRTRRGKGGRGLYYCFSGAYYEQTSKHRDQPVSVTGRVHGLHHRPTGKRHTVARANHRRSAPCRHAEIQSLQWRVVLPAGHGHRAAGRCGPGTADDARQRRNSCGRFTSTITGGVTLKQSGRPASDNIHNTTSAKRAVMYSNTGSPVTTNTTADTKVSAKVTDAGHTRVLALFLER